MSKNYYVMYYGLPLKQRLMDDFLDHGRHPPDLLSDP
jgi:hypothetical protein